MRKIGIIGSGIVGQTLAKGFIKHGYDVMIGSEHIEKLSSWKTEVGNNGKIGSFNDVASFGSILILAVKGTAAKEVLNSINEEHLNGKTIIDATNPIEDMPPENGVLKFFTSLEGSLMEELQTGHPDSHFVKAFNSIGAAHMVNPKFSETPSMFIAGNNEKAKKEVSEIIEKFGFNVEDMGKAQAARAIEPLCMLWCIPGFLKNDWSHAFKLIR